MSYYMILYACIPDHSCNSELGRLGPAGRSLHHWRDGWVTFLAVAAVLRCVIVMNIYDRISICISIIRYLA